MDGFMSHDMRYQWQPGILALHVLSDGLTVLAYASIAGAILYVMRRRIDVGRRWLFLSFAILNIACSAMYIMEIWTYWRPINWLGDGLKACTALASVSAAIFLIRYLPSAERATRADHIMHLEALNRTLTEDGARSAIAADAAEQFRLAIEAAPTGMLLTDLRGSIVLVNAQVETLFG
jgi:PAS domain-containing protein